MTEQELITGCQHADPLAQRALYECYAPTMLGVCRRYLSRTEDAEDVLVESFCKVFEHLDQYSGNGSFEGWIRRIVVNESLMFLRKKHALRNAYEIQEHFDLRSDENIVAELAAQDILFLLDQLPNGYRTVFNLYVVEGYKHREIADLLEISINTSKSQLILAKKRLQQLLLERNYPGVQERLNQNR
ncbi:MAG: RNA polymerase subunit sigma-70 [Bacteroidetes bacterium]|nr:MAG: RNA polymerase subunit sigma-70 [Bacteroidota bacterium]PTM08903.1 MAG: RNA polymerase subunit sigma-70 [Bacteroidota bacterium]